MGDLYFKFGPDDSINWDSKSIANAIDNGMINKKINEETMLMHSVKVNDIKLAKQLLDLNADMTLGDLSNRTPLWLCTIYNRPEIAELLIKNGADMEEVPGTNTPLYNALKHDNNAVAKMLIDLGANTDVPNRDGKLALDCAIFRENYEMIDYIKNASKHRKEYLLNNKQVNNTFKKNKKKFIDRNVSFEELENSLLNAILESKNMLKIDRVMKDGFSPNFKLKEKDILYYLLEKNDEEVKKIINKLKKYGFDKEKHDKKLVQEVERKYDISLDNTQEVIIKNELIRIYKSIYKNDLDMFKKLEIPKNKCLYNIDIPAFCDYYNRKFFVDYLLESNIRFDCDYETIDCDDIFFKKIMDEVNHEKFQCGISYDYGYSLDLTELYSSNNYEGYSIENDENNVGNKTLKKNKKIGKFIFFLIIIIVLLIILFPFLNHRDENEQCTANYYDGEELFKKISFKCGNKIENIYIEKDGYNFEGWYFNGNEYDFSKSVSDDINLYAKWIEKNVIENNNINDLNDADKNSNNNNIKDDNSNSSDNNGNNNNFSNIIDENIDIEFNGTPKNKYVDYAFVENDFSTGNFQYLNFSDLYNVKNSVSYLYDIEYTSSNPNVAIINNTSIGEISVKGLGVTTLTRCNISTTNRTKKKCFSASFEIKEGCYGNLLLKPKGVSFNANQEYLITDIIDIEDNTRGLCNYKYSIDSDNGVINNNKIIFYKTGTYYISYDAESLNGYGGTRSSTYVNVK